MRTTDEIYEEMRAAYAGKTGLVINDGGDMALRLYAVASQMYCLWVQSEYISRQAFPQTAEGEYLDRHAEMRGLERGEAARASGTLRFRVNEAREEDLAVPPGTACMTAAALEFATVRAGGIKAGELYCDIPAEASVPGVSGNVPAESILYMEHAPSGVAEVYNPEAFSGGADSEDDASLRERVVSSYRKLPNGANSAYYEARALDTEGVAAVSVLPKRRGVGTVDIIITDAAGPAGQTLIKEVSDKLKAEREICVDISVGAPRIVPVSIAAEITAGDGYDPETVRARAEDAVTAYFTGERLGQSVLMAKLGSILYSVEGVENYYIASPAGDVAVAADELPMLSTVTITAAEA